MRGHLAFAEGSPCPTLVLQAEALPRNEPELLDTLSRVHTRLRERGQGHALKIGMAAPSRSASHDLDYRFAQCLPSDHVDNDAFRFDLRGSCGHSLLSSVLVAAHAGWIAPLQTGTSTRVRVLNNADTVLCTADRVESARVVFTIQFSQPAPLPLGELLPLGEPVSSLAPPGGVVRVSAVSHGNPYVFVDATDLGCTTPQQLFAADHLLDTLHEIRTAAEKRLNWPPGAFPKVAAVGQAGDGEIAVRSLSVPTWHPTLAVTGAVCLAAAAAVEGTIPAMLGQADDEGRLRVRTQAGHATVRSSVVGGALHWVSVAPKPVHLLNTVELGAEPVAACAGRNRMVA